MNRYTDQWDRIENPEIDPHKHAQLIFEVQKQLNEGRTTFQQIVLKQLDIHRQKMDCHPNLMTYTNINTK